MQKPVIFLAFANDKVDYAHRLNLVVEQNEISKILEENFIEKKLLMPFNKADFLKDFAEQGSNFRVFHYGGHGGKDILFFEDFDSNTKINAQYLMNYLAGFNLKLIFLNACDTYEIGENLKLLESCCVICTKGKIDDDIAIEFAKTFYLHLANGNTIGKAFELTKNAQKITDLKSKSPNDWHLLGTEEGKNWKLEKIDEKPISNDDYSRKPFIFQPENQFYRFIWRWSFSRLDFKKSYWEALENNIFGKTKLKDTFAEYVIPSEYIFEIEDRNQLLTSLPKDQREKKQQRTKDLFPLFLEGFLSAPKPYILLLADSGMGKTTFLRKLFVKYAQTYPDFDLAFVYCGQDTDEQLAQISNPEKTVLFLDALDEDIKARNHLQDRLIDLGKRLAPFAKVVVSCRVQFFPNKKEEWEYLLGNIKFYILTLNQFTIEEAKEYLMKKYGSKNDYFINRAFYFKKYNPFRKEKPNYQKDYLKNEKQEKAWGILKRNPSFFCRPLLLSYFDDLLDTTEPFDFLYQIFEHIVAKWAAREEPVVEGNKPNQRTYHEDMPKKSKNLAHKLYDLQLSEVPLEELKDKNFQSRSLITRNRDTDKYAFTHDSFYNYFLAVLLFDGKIEEENPKTGEYKNIFKQIPEVEDFYKEMLWHKILDFEKKQGIETVYGVPEPFAYIQNKQIRAYIAYHLNHFQGFEDAKYFFKVIEKLKELGVKHYFISYLDNYQKCLDTFSMFVDRNHFVELFLEKIYEFLIEKLKLKKDLGKDKFKKDLVKDIWELKNLQRLGFYDNKLTNFPKEIKELRNLQALDLSWNKLKILPKGIKELRNLQRLDLGANQLSILSEEIKELKNLQELDLWDNQFSIFPEGIKELRNLQTLNLRWNQLSILPKEIKELQNLQRLDLTRNQLTNLPRGIKELQNLQRLYLNLNPNLDLVDTFQKLSKLKNLQILYLVANQLTSLHET
ncbi:MAG: hypothetical protein EAZ97_08695 [Bacteroidetes bacterium]|nr:MAG: hypothetical protein EAZ97_08695 [Bacteroidota bacterium]